jgi:hypothetical protein
MSLHLGKSKYCRGGPEQIVGLPYKYIGIDHDVGPLLGEGKRSEYGDISIQSPITADLSFNGIYM